MSFRTFDRMPSSHRRLGPLFLFVPSPFARPAVVSCPFFCGMERTGTGQSSAYVCICVCVCLCMYVGTWYLSYKRDEKPPQAVKAAPVATPAVDSFPVPNCAFLAAGHSTMAPTPYTTIGNHLKVAF